jgi:hypothetical protein
LLPHAPQGSSWRKTGRLSPIALGGDGHEHGDADDSDDFGAYDGGMGNHRGVGADSDSDAEQLY